MKTFFYKSLFVSLVFLLPLVVLAQKKKWDKPLMVKEAQLHSRYNNGIASGKKIGMDEGYHKGYNAGFLDGENAGMERGFSLGKAWVADSILATVYLLDKYGVGPSECGKLYDIVRKEFHDVTVWREDLRLKYTDEGKKIGYEQGFLDAYKIQFDSIFRLQLRHGQNVTFPGNVRNYPFILDYEKIARLMGTMNGRSPFVEKTFFNDAFYQVNTAMLEFLTGVIKLTFSEKAEVFQRYGEIHSQLSDRCYEQYKQLCQTINRNYEKDFYNYQFSISTEAFLDVVYFNMVPIADVTFTYAKSNGQYATWMGFEMGSVNQILLEKVLVPLSDYFRKNAIRLDYDAHFPQLVPVAVSLLMPIVAETRTHSKVISEQLALSGDHSVTIKMRINTTIQVGYALEDFSIIPNHNKQQVWVTMSDLPRMISLVQDYQVIEMISDVRFNGRCRFMTTLDETQLDAIFKKHLDPVESLPIYSTPLPLPAREIITPILRKTIEPSVAIPYSCYAVKLSFGSRTSDLVSIRFK
jgi:hypothetical protein